MRWCEYKYDPCYEWVSEQEDDMKRKQTHTKAHNTHAHNQ